MNHVDPIKHNGQVLLFRCLNIFSSSFFFVTRERGFLRRRKIWAPFFPWQRNDRDHSDFRQVRTYVRMKLANYVPGSQWHIADVPTGSRWNDTSPAGTVPKWARSYWITQRYHSSDSRPLRHPPWLSPLAVSRILGKTCQIDGKRPPWPWYTDKDEVLVLTQLLLELCFYICCVRTHVHT